jgi:uncharacterized protein YecE (DUF72 family)
LEPTSAPRIGTVDVPQRIDRERYFHALSFVELSTAFAGPPKPSALTKWAALAPPGTIGLQAPFVFTHRTPPSTSAPLWPHDAGTGDFRISPLAGESVSRFLDIATQLRARSIVFRSPEMFSPSAANRDSLRRFFSEVVPAELGPFERVWLPGGLWEVRTAVTLAKELDVTPAFDPTVRAPQEPPEVYFDLDAPALYFRIENAGRAGPMRQELIEEIADLAESYADRELTIAFASAERWADARHLTKMLRSESAGAIDSDGAEESEDER